MRKELESSIKGVRDTIKISFLEYRVGYLKAYLSVERELRSRRGAAITGAVCGIIFVAESRELAAILAVLGILHKEIAIRDGEKEYGEEIEGWIEKEETRLKELETGSKEK